jgi:hypothetical protein
MIQPARCCDKNVLNNSSFGGTRGDGAKECRCRPVSSAARQQVRLSYLGLSALQTFDTKDVFHFCRVVDHHFRIHPQYGMRRNRPMLLGKQQNAIGPVTLDCVSNRVYENSISWMTKISWQILQVLLEGRCQLWNGLRKPKQPSS